MSACSDDEGEFAGKQGTLTLQLSSGSLTAVTRADVDHESYIDDVDLFFYPGGSESEAAAFAIRNISVGSNSKSYTANLTASQLNAIFPDGATTCTIYAVANVSKSFSDEATMASLKATALATAFNSSDFDASTWNIPMDGLGSVELNKTSMTVSGSVSLQRAISKITLNIDVATEISSDGKTYVPVQTDKSIYAYLYNGAMAGRLNGFSRDDNHNYTDYTGDNSYSQVYTKVEKSATTRSDETTTYISYTHVPFYSYPNEWSLDASDHETIIRLSVPWRVKGTTGEYQTYYYQLPINDLGRTLDRNKSYTINLTVGVLGSTSVAEPEEINTATYEVADWSDGNTTLDEKLSSTDYLVVEDNNFTIINTSDLSFSYSSCIDLKNVYLVSVEYESTLFSSTNNSSGYTKIYLYNSDYDDTTKSYSETSSYSDNDQTARGKYTDVITELDNITVTDQPDKVDGAFIGTGKINFHASVENIAAKLYRPVTYTVALMGSGEVDGIDHLSLHTLVRITQYPARYIVLNQGGNVFVNGYFARLSPDADYSTSDVSWPSGSIENVDGNYRSYSFIYSGWNSNYSRYSSTSNVAYKLDYGSGNNDYYTKRLGINASYEYVRGKFASDESVKCESTVDVYVSAFSSSDNYFTVKVNSSDKRYDYVIGTPLKKGSFKKDETHSTGSYSWNNNELYDYYVKGASEDVTETSNGGNNNESGGNNNESGGGFGGGFGGFMAPNETTTTTTTYYYRYVESWGDNAEKIMIGGDTEEYDNIIAPSFKIQSSYGAATNSVYYRVAQKRCATYQEAGYPAGRWRLPTLAEIQYVIYLQNQGVIENMFSTNSQGYWTSSGGRIIVSSNAYTGNYNSNGGNNCFVRCVYDTWYWGEKPVTPTHQYHPKPYF
jgi:hypothetical protein